MKFLRFSSGFFLLVYFLAGTVSAAINIQVFSKDEGFYETNISKPRVYIQNLANSEPISNFFAYYYFTVENNKVPVLEDYYTPVSNISLENLGDGNYRLKFDYSGITLQPGQTIPNTDGEVTGLHYTDWSNFDKTNDVSNNRQSIFTLNYSIPVYLSNGTLIYGDGVVPPTPSVPTLPPTAGNPGNFAVYSIERTDLRDRAHINAGDAGSIGTLEAGCDAVISGNTLSGGEMTLRERAHITGNAVSKGRITTQNGIVIDGNRQENAQVVLLNIARVNVIPGTQNITVSPDGSYTLNPGTYADFQAYSRSTVTITPGNYTFRKFLIEPDVRLILQAGPDDQRIKIQVKENLRFGDRTIMSFTGGVPYSYSVNFYSSQTEQLFIGTDAVLYGLISAPDAEVHIYSRSLMNGSLFGKQVIVEPDAVVCKPPVLGGLFHSEGAMATAFDPLLLNYSAVVPDATATILVTPITIGSQTVTVNGHPPTTSINLANTETKISVLLTQPEACGTTEYTLNVKKAAQYQIFVNDNSPCAPGSEDGLTWATAYKNLQAALDRAGTEGREIWIAEGLYTPTRMIDTTDPRSVTFSIQPGIEVIGGFAGNENVKNPQGSPYNTIISGDIVKNDSLLSTWPPISPSDSLIIADNAYHVMTINGPATFSGISISGVSIQNGNANKPGAFSMGAGVYCIGKLPSLEKCIIRKNRALGNGAGIYAQVAPDSLFNCFFQSNISLNGQGGGLFISLSNGVSSILASVFQNNQASSSSNSSSGGGIYWNNSNGSLINCVFYGNTCTKDGGGLFLNNSSVNITNCTFVRNSAQLCGGGIKSNSSDLSVIFNTILWENQANTESELSGPYKFVGYSCISEGYAGGSNIITSTPFFLDINNPAGENGHFGDFSDGLNLSINSSPCVNAGKDSINIPATDIVLTPRTNPDIGAYEAFSPTIEGEKTFGYIDPSGNFVPDEPIKALDTIRHWWYINIYASSNLGYVARTYIPKNKYTKNKSSIYVNLYSLNADGSLRADLSPVKITLYKVDDYSDKMAFQSRTPSKTGKPIIFVMEKTYHNWNNNWAYVISTTSGNFKVVIPGSQF